MEILLAILIALVSVSFVEPTDAADLLNVVMIAVDDLRPEFGQAYGTPEVKTPFMDSLAKQGVTFQRAYCQAATCGVSRSSILTGRRPDTTHVLSNEGCFRRAGNWTSLPHYFKQNGYTTAGGGKIFHPGVCDGLEFGEDRFAWSLPYYHAPCPQLGSLPCEEPRGDDHRPYSWFSNETATDEEMPDGMIATNAINTLRNLSQNAATPFFLAVGFHKPHLPHIAPKKYFDMYPLEDISLPRNPNIPKDLPEIAWNNCNELLSYHDAEEAAKKANFSMTRPLEDDEKRRQRRAYYASTTFVDAQVGRVMAELDELGLTNKTIVMLWGDHGWHLGENNEWAKHTNFERATHVPLIILAPDGGKNLQTDALTELVDVYPTLADLAGLAVPPVCPTNSSSVDVCTEGVSLAALVRDPSTKWKNASFSQWPKGKIMGYTMRTDQYRYTEWVNYDHDKFAPDWKQLSGRELYDFVHDPNETQNMVDQPQVKETVSQLQAQLHAGWRQT